MLPDPTVLGPLLADDGGDPSLEANRRAHYAGMAAKSAAGSGEAFWDEYNHSYVRSIGVMKPTQTRRPRRYRPPATPSCGAGRFRRASQPWPNSPRWVCRWVWCRMRAVRSPRCCRGAACARQVTGHTPRCVVVDSHVVGVAKPDPRIFDHALPYFDGIDRHEIAYVGDSVTMDIGAATAAGLHPILLDPYDDHPEADFERIRSLTELAVAHAA